MKAVVFSLGCKVNQYEGQSLITQLIERGIEASDKLESADIYIINTCSVTAEADKKSRQMVSKVLSKNKNASVFICGCSSQNNPTAYINKANVKFVSGVGKKGNLADTILEHLMDDASQLGEFTLPKNYEDDLFPAHTKTRSYIKIQDGCDNFCSYCIVPHLRGRSRSRLAESIIAEAETAAKDTREIVLTGINISDYGKNIGSNLTQLVDKFKNINARIRLGSLECTVIDKQLLLKLKENNFCDHFHLSLQSGCDSVLKRMNRHYSAGFYLEKVGLIREIFPDAAITTDIIAGFSAETEIEHMQTLNFIKSVGFADAHVFPYSVREGTNAAKLQQIDVNIRAKRATEIADTIKVSKNQFINSQLGKSKTVYFEEENANYFTGFTENYIKVYASGENLSNQLCNVTLIKQYQDGVIAVVNKNITK